MTSIWVTLIFMHTVYGKQIHDLILIRLNSVTLTNICDPFKHVVKHKKTRCYPTKHT